MFYHDCYGTKSKDALATIVIPHNIIMLPLIKLCVQYIQIYIMLEGCSYYQAPLCVFPLQEKLSCAFKNIRGPGYEAIII